MKPVAKIWDGQSVSSTTTYRSAVTKCPSGTPPAEYLATFDFTSTPNGTLSLEINNMQEVEYKQAVAAASGGLEANNTTGWQQKDLSPSATITVTSGASQNVTVKGRMVRFRFKYVNASSSGTVTGRLAMPG